MSYKVLILDLDGTVYTDGKPIKDIIPKLNNYKIEGNKIYYLSNNTSVSVSYYFNKLRDLGLNVSVDEIITPSIISGRYLENKYKRGFIVGTKSFISELENKYSIRNDFKNPDFVLITFDKELTYDKLMIASKFINRDIPYYITHIDLACPSENGPIPDCGSISLLIESVTKKKPKEDFGKPSLRMVEYISGLLNNINKEEVLMVGDRLYTDIALGNKLGVKTLLVLSGEGKFEDIEKNKEVEVIHCSHTLSDFLSGEDLLLK